LIATSAFGLLLYSVVASLSYYVYFARNRERFVPTYKARPREIRSAVLWSIYGLLGNAVLVLPVQLLIVTASAPGSWATAMNSGARMRVWTGGSC